MDGTLTRSKSPIEAGMTELLGELLKKYKVAIISGATFKQFEWQVLDSLKSHEEVMKNLHLLPVDGTVSCLYNGTWQCKEDNLLSNEEKESIRTALDNIFEKSELEKPEEVYGEPIEDRGAQLNFSALGQEAPIEVKEKWDPDNKKREKMIEVLRPSLPNLSMRIGGTTSIEVTRQGVDKAYGLTKLMDRTTISKDKVLYVGDKLFAGGNDEPVMTLGVETQAVLNPEETKQVIKELIGL